MVHFVGAGCGAADLITLRGKRLIEEADVIIYAGSLVNTELLDGVKPGTVLYNSAEMTFEEILDVIFAAEKKGSVIVRLHSGDPCLYGAIGEQMAALEEHQIPYDICPGVSAFCGAAAALKTEYTLPDVSQSVIITRVPGKSGAVPEGERIRALAAHHSTMVVFLSTGHLAYLEQELMAGGLPADTPAAIVYKASWPEEKICPCSVSTLRETAEREGIRRTALICIGEVLGRKKGKRSRLYAADYSTPYRNATE